MRCFEGPGAGPGKTPGGQHGREAMGWHERVEFVRGGRRGIAGGAAAGMEDGGICRVGRILPESHRAADSGWAAP